MAESSHQQQRLAVVRSAALGEVVEVQGGHIVRATGRKDRHSKVCTAKGPRDRRVRLAAHTAIQFYDVQDRLGYDRPSKAVDWLIKKAKSSIDELAQLPAWHPTAISPAAAAAAESEQKQNAPINSNIPGPSSKRAAAIMAGGEDDHHHRNISHNPNTQIASFLPPSMDSDAIADTIKSFFPVGASGEATSSAMQFHSFNSSELMSRSGSHSQDLRLSLHSLQDPILLQHQSPTHHSQSPRLHGQVLLSGTPLGFDGGWADHQQQQAELSRLQRFADAAPAGYFFNPPPAQPQPPPPPPPLLQQLLGHNQFISQRGPLQSSNTPSVRAWFDPLPAAAASSGGFDHSHHHQQQGSAPYYSPSVSGFGFTSGYGGFPGFHIPARIQGDEEEHDGYSDKPSSASSDSRH